MNNFIFSKNHLFFFTSQITETYEASREKTGENINLAIENYVIDENAIPTKIAIKYPKKGYFFSFNQNVNKGALFIKGGKPQVINGDKCNTLEFN